LRERESRVRGSTSWGEEQKGGREAESPLSGEPDVGLHPGTPRS